MSNINIMDVSTGLLGAVPKTGDKPISRRSSGTSSMNVSTSSTPVASGYMGNSVARLIQKLTMSSNRTLSRHRPTPSFVGSMLAQGAYAFAQYQASVEVSSTLSYAYEWYWEIDGKNCPLLEFSSWRSDLERTEIDVHGCTSSDFHPGLRLTKIGSWTKVNATRFVRPILADPSLALAAFDVYEASISGPVDATRVTPVIYNYNCRYGTSSRVISTGAKASIAEAWALYSERLPGEQPFIISDMVLGKTDVPPPVSYTRYLVILTPKGQTKYLVVEGQLFDIEWVSKMLTLPAQPSYAPKSYSATISPPLLTYLLPRYGSSVAFDVGEVSYRPVISALKIAGHSVHTSTVSAPVTSLDDGTIDYGTGRPHLVGETKSYTGGWYYSSPILQGVYLAGATNEYSAWMVVRDKYRALWQDAYYSSMGGGYLYVGPSSPAPNVDTTGATPAGGWPTAPIVSRPNLRGRLPFAVPGYPGKT